MTALSNHLRALRLLAALGAVVPLAAQGSPAPAAPAPSSPAPTLPSLPGVVLPGALPVPTTPQGEQPTQPGPDAVPSAKDVLQGLPGTAQGSEAEANRQIEKEILELKKAYRGAFILASDLFAGSSSFRQSPMASVSDDYRLGSGDTMTLYVFGSATFELPVSVDRAGNITVPKVGTIHVAGLRLGDARQQVQKLVNSLFSRSRVDLQFLKTRDVRIFILGEVYRPGSYVVPSLTSMLNALSVSGGPNPMGTTRNIQLIRDGKVIQTLDLYPLRLQGLGMESLLLRDGDTLFVPILGSQVLMDGAFVRVLTAPANKDFPGVLVELKATETAWDAVRFIGGLAPNAYRSLITLRRTDPNGVINVQNLLPEEAALKGLNLFPNDRLVALTRAERPEGIVEVAGYARVPGAFAFRPAMTVADLLLNPSQIQPDTYMGRGQILRTLDDQSTELLAFDLTKALQKDPAHNLALHPRDRVELFKVDDLRQKRTVKVLGPFSKPGTYDWHDRMRAADLIFAAGVPKLNADRFYAELAHFEPDGRPGAIQRLDLAKLLYTEERSAAGLTDAQVNPLLSPYDQITLYEIPDFKIHRTVTISGQVQRPGPYVFTDRHFTLRQLIARAGGLTREAMTKGGIFLRGALEEKDLSKAELEKAGVKALDPTAQGLNDILQRLSETKRTKETGLLLASPVLHGLASGAINRLVVDFEAALKGDERRDVVLLDGDQIIIPRQAESAYVVGEVASPFATFRVKGGDKVSDVLKMAGGFTRNADQSQVRLLKADGRILDSWVESREVEPGDAILVPQRFRVNTTWQDNLQALTPLALIWNAIRR
ncbi:MAG: SLBB domain-containing protein [Holophagaceae bacterium]